MIKVNPYEIERTDIIIGIPSYNEVDNIAHVAQQCAVGCSKYLSKYKTVIINVDNNSPDNTKEAFLNSGNTVPKIYLSTKPGVKGKGNNFYNLFTEATKLGAFLVIVIDADITSITPEWVKDLAAPILTDEYDFVSPLYTRNEYDGTITNNICYPLLYGLLGRDLRQAIGGDFAFSSKLVNHYLNQRWQPTTFQFGIDIFMTLNALLGEFKLCQVGLGTKIHKPSAPKLGEMFSQVVGTLFDSLIESKEQWRTDTQLTAIPLYREKTNIEPQQLSIDYKSIKRTALAEYNQYQQLLKTSLSSEVFEKVDDMYGNAKIRIGSVLWAKIVFELLFQYEKMERDKAVIEALKPLYFGRVTSFIRQTLDLDYHASERKILDQAKCFYKLKNHLLDKYSEE